LEAILVKLRCHRDIVQHIVISLLSFDRRDAPDGLQEPPAVKPIDPFQRGVFDGLDRPPRPSAVDYLGFVEAVDCLG
jgi:hypothetical protein